MVGAFRVCGKIVGAKSSRVEIMRMENRRGGKSPKIKIAQTVIPKMKIAVDDCARKRNRAGANRGK